MQPDTGNGETDEENTENNLSGNYEASNINSYKKQKQE